MNNYNNSWDSLSMKDKAEMMRVAINNGITTLSDIKEAYNKFAEGGPLKEWTLEDEANYRSWKSQLPRNLRNTNDEDYDMRAAFKAGLQPEWNEEDKSYHLGSRDPKTGRILKSPHHHTFLKALTTDARMGYYPTIDKNGNIYTETWEGNEYAGGGYIPSSKIRKDIAAWEGSSMKTNRSFEAEAKDFNAVIPKSIRNKLSTNQLDALYSYGYNVGMGNLKKRVLPVLEYYTQGKATNEDVQQAMWASKDSQLRGLTNRRNWEREMFGGNYRSKYTGMPSSYTISQNFFDNINDQIHIPEVQVPLLGPATKDPNDPANSYKPPVIDDTIFQKPVVEEEAPVYDPKQERIDRIQNFNYIMNLMGQQSPLAIFDSKGETPGMMSYISQIYQ